VTAPWTDRSLCGPSKTAPQYIPEVWWTLRVRQ
jgi:hypothetical protein